MRVCEFWSSRTRSSSRPPSPTASRPRVSTSTSPTTATTASGAPGKGSYDAIVLDILLPGIHGYKVCRTLRDEGIWTPILILTAKGRRVRRSRGARHRRRRLPLEAVLVRGAARPPARADPRGAPRGPNALTVGALELDPGTRRVRRGDTDIRLTAREFALLEFLMRKDGNVASKAEILDHVWGIDFAGDPNVVEVYVGYLRKKIDQPFIGRDHPDRARRRVPVGARGMTPGWTRWKPRWTRPSPRIRARWHVWPRTVRWRSRSPRRSCSRSRSVPPRSVSCASCTTTSSTASGRRTSSSSTRCRPQGS